MDLKSAAPAPPPSSSSPGPWVVVHSDIFFFPHMGRAVAEINIIRSVD